MRPVSRMSPEAAFDRVIAFLNQALHSLAGDSSALCPVSKAFSRRVTGSSLFQMILEGRLQRVGRGGGSRPSSAALPQAVAPRSANLPAHAPNSWSSELIFIVLPPYEFTFSCSDDLISQRLSGEPPNRLNRADRSGIYRLYSPVYVKTALVTICPDKAGYRPGYICARLHLFIDILASHVGEDRRHGYCRTRRRPYSRRYPRKEHLSPTCTTSHHTASTGNIFHRIQEPGRRWVSGPGRSLTTTPSTVWTKRWPPGSRAVSPKAEVSLRSRPTFTRHAHRSTFLSQLRPLTFAGWLIDSARMRRRPGICPRRHQRRVCRPEPRRC